MSGQSGSDTGSMGAAGRMVLEEMARERRSFWGILVVFFLLLVGIGGLIAYNTLEIADLGNAARLKEFRDLGRNAEALSELRNQISTSSIRQKKLEMDRVAEQKMVGESLAWRNGVTPPQLKSAALDYARRHFLGESLNMSSGSVVAYAVEGMKTEAQPSADALLLRAAVADWNTNEDEASRLGQALSAQPDGARRAFGHAALAAANFRRAQLPGNGFGWDKGCSDVVGHVEAAQAAGATVIADSYIAAGNLEAAGLNLDYWRGQCLRRHGDSEQAKDSFDRMLRIAEMPALPDENPFKFQAFHGAGTVMTAMIDESSIAETLAEATRLLKRAGELRIKNGAAPTGAFGSTENISFLLLRGEENDRLVQVLEHTGGIDTQSSLTWNLVARLAAARALHAQAFPAAFSDPELQADYAALQAKYGDTRQLERILFETQAKLAMRTEPSLARKELKALLGPDFEGALWIGVKCIRAKEACVEVDPLADVAESDVAETQPASATAPAAAPETAAAPAAATAASAPQPN